jgi:hypothetical protein
MGCDGMAELVPAGFCQAAVSVCPHGKAIDYHDGGSDIAWGTRGAIILDSNFYRNISIR